MTIQMIARAAFALLLVLAAWLSVSPSLEPSEAGFGVARWLAGLLFGDEAAADKIGHFLVYGALGATAALGRLALAGRLLFTVLALAAYGALLEGAQGWLTQTRSPEVLDALANTAGAGAGAILGALARMAASRRRTG
ncbi:VanZ family protein [Amphiplicatus metriothermophilus]|uniref:VanZ like family protein n=1 Tax=Amphiplicatus metriothermophilus TaxID=1519374 RepID=A0A239PWD2_9PROT|nr:VanZ family protein [Amphiplicatus metriothermophilus]MBB5519689.1 hypothetical protein [Amphiplicatus metriothermophilus]SNT74252.1 hypothetical protein SAMN06297382_2163 [Amphiplicatus metriothermophilus]